MLKGALQIVALPEWENDFGRVTPHTCLAKYAAENVAEVFNVLNISDSVRKVLQCWRERTARMLHVEILSLIPRHCNSFCKFHCLCV